VQKLTRKAYFQSRLPVLQCMQISLDICKQCCGYGSGIRRFFIPRVRDGLFPDPESRIQDPGTQIKVEYLTFIYFMTIEKEDEIKFVYFNNDLKIQEKFIFSLLPSFDVGSGSGINIPGRQHCLQCIMNRRICSITRPYQKNIF
jgi:hypothetical protein